MPEIEIILPTFHPAQIEAYKVFKSSKRTAIRCGRRWGKTDFAKIIVCDAVIRGQSIGWFAPNYKIQTEAYAELGRTLQPIMKSSSKVDGVMRTTTGGRIDYWTLENERAGASRKYHGIVIDEAAFGKDNVIDIWQQAMEPTLLDYEGWVLALSNTNGVNPGNFFYRICTDEPSEEKPKGEFGFTEYHSPSRANVHLPARKKGETDEEHRIRRDAAFEELKRTKHPMVYRQEYLAEFVDFSGDAFFQDQWLLVDGKPVEYPKFCDAVFAVIDTAVKTGTDNDGTAVSYWALGTKVNETQWFGHPLTCLDWDYVQVEGAMLEQWIPAVFARLEELARQCNARGGSRGAYIEDAQSGSVLIQQCLKRRLPAKALPAKLTSVGKDARAINASGPVFQGQVKWSEFAYRKGLSFKGLYRNHMTIQVNSFRIGDKDAAKRADDLLDTFTYAVAITLGNSKGWA